MILNYVLRKRVTDIMHDYKTLSSNARAHKEIRNSTDCSAFKYVSRIQFLLTISTALSTSPTFLTVKVFQLVTWLLPMAQSVHSHQRHPISF